MIVHVDYVVWRIVIQIAHMGNLAHVSNSVILHVSHVYVYWVEPEWALHLSNGISRSKIFDLLYVIP